MLVWAEQLRCGASIGLRSGFADLTLMGMYGVSDRRRV
jgi:hypothetical protein